MSYYEARLAALDGAIFSQLWECSDWKEFPVTGLLKDCPEETCSLADWMNGTGDQTVEHELFHLITKERKRKTLHKDYETPSIMNLVPAEEEEFAETDTKRYEENYG